MWSWGYSVFNDTSGVDPTSSVVGSGDFKVLGVEKGVEVLKEAVGGSFLIDANGSV